MGCVAVLCGIGGNAHDFSGWLEREISGIVGGAEEILVAVLGHPAGAGEMAFPRAARAIGFARWIDMQDDSRDLGPIGTVSFGINQEKVAQFVREFEQHHGDDDVTDREWGMIEERAARRASEGCRGRGIAWPLSRCMKLRYERGALADLADIFAYIAEDNRAAAAMEGREVRILEGR
jgi:hypothetical protein